MKTIIILAVILFFGYAWLSQLKELHDEHEELKKKRDEEANN